MPSEKNCTFLCTIILVIQTLYIA